MKLALTMGAVLAFGACRAPERDCAKAEPEPAQTCPPAPSQTCPVDPVIASVMRPLPLDLPSASHGVDQQVFFAIDMTNDGSCFVDGTKLASCDDIQGLAKIAVAKNPEIRATIRADKSVTHGAVIRIIDLLKQAGLHKVAFGVSKTP